MQARKTAVALTMLLGGAGLALTLAQAPTLDTARKPQVLKHEWQAGKTYLHRMEMDQTSSIAMGDQTMDQSVHMNMDMDLTVSAIAGSKNKRVRSEYKRIAMNMATMGMEMKFDSAEPESAEGPLSAMGDLVGHKFDIIVDGQNKIVDVEGFEELAKVMGADPVSAELGKRMVDKEQLDQMLNTWMTQGLPKKAVKPGDSWPLDVTMDMAQLGSVNIRGTVTLAGYQEFAGHDCAVLDMEARITMDLDGKAVGNDPEAQGVGALGLSVKDGKATSRMFWDPTLHTMRRLELNQTMLLTMTNPADGSLMSIPMDQKIRTTLEVR